MLPSTGGGRRAPRTSAKSFTLRGTKLVRTRSARPRPPAFLCVSGPAACFAPADSFYRRLRDKTGRLLATTTTTTTATATTATTTTTLTTIRRPLVPYNTCPVCEPAESARGKRARISHAYRPAHACIARQRRETVPVRYSTWFRAGDSRCVLEAVYRKEFSQLRRRRRR